MEARLDEARSLLDAVDQLTIGRGDDALRDVADYYGLERDEIAVDPDWLRYRRPASGR